MAGLVDKGVVVSETFYPTKLTGGKSMQATTAIKSVDHLTLPSRHETRACFFVTKFINDLIIPEIQIL